jgi:hypothetical protein
VRLICRARALTAHRAGDERPYQSVLIINSSVYSAGMFDVATRKINLDPKCNLPECHLKPPIYISAIKEMRKPATKLHLFKKMRLVF